MFPLVRAPLSLALLLSFVAAPAAQDEVSPSEMRAAVLEAVHRWVADFERGRLGSHGMIRRGANLQPGYVAPMRRVGLVTPRDYGRITHLDMLGKLLSFAERHPDAELAEAMLDVASVGFDRAFLDHQALEVRELGHWSLLRVEDDDVWFLILRVARGDDAEREEAPREGVVTGPARRVGALRLLGMRNRPVFRGTIEGCLSDEDPRVRLAAVEALDFQRRPASLSSVVEAVRLERHPVVSQALVRLIRRLVTLPGEEPLPEARREAVDVALAQMGHSGWRTDMEQLDLVERFPSREAIPKLIDALERVDEAPDELVATVNRRASALLREKAGGLLRAMTGTLIPLDDIEAWRAFWEREKDRIVVPPVLEKPRPGGTRAKFFGVPVTGSSIAFLIDTSGSMEEAVSGTKASGRLREADTRIGAAKSQIVLAVQAMDPASRYQLLTFSDCAVVWTQHPVKPGKATTRALTEVLSRLRAVGGTNLYDGLVQALQLDELGYGEQNETRIDELFVLSDGEPTAGEVQDAESLLALVREANRYAKVRIHCVFTGDGKGADLMRRLAEENGGVFVRR